MLVLKALVVLRRRALADEAAAVGALVELDGAARGNARRLEAAERRAGHVEAVLGVVVDVAQQGRSAACTSVSITSRWIKGQGTYSCRRSRWSLQESEETRRGLRDRTRRRRRCC